MQNYCYLGTKIIEHDISNLNIINRIAQRKIYLQTTKKHLLNTNNIGLDTRIFFETILMKCDIIEI